MHIPRYARWFLPSLESGIFPVPIRGVNTHRRGEIVAFAIRDVQIFAEEFYHSRGQQIVSGTANKLFRDVFDLIPCGVGKRFYALSDLPSMRERWLLHFPGAKFPTSGEWILTEQAED